MTHASDLFLRAAGLRKAYGPVTVLADVDFDLRRGEVHALVGENGAGKSTLSRILAGLLRPDAGILSLAGRVFAPGNRQAAERAGVRMVLQELNRVGNLTVAESLFLDRLPHRWGWIDFPKLHSDTRSALHRVGLVDVEPTTPIDRLGVGQRQLVEIAAGLAGQCDVLILDEPTAALTAPEIERLFGQIEQLRAAGVAILYISHRMEEIRRLANRISILRDGQMIATRPTGELSLDEMVRLMVGRDLEPDRSRSGRTLGSVALRVESLGRGRAVQDVSFEVRRGEVLGFAGLMGSGRTETMRAIFGADRPDFGRILVGDPPAPVSLRSPADAVRRGIALLTEDRKEQGLLLPLSIQANLTLPSLARACARLGWIRGGTEAALGRRWIESLAVRCRDALQPVAELSGGNQQKVVVAKWLLRDCDILIFDEPTRGIDVGAKFEIYRWLERLAAAGKAIIVVSSDLKELMSVADRIAVMSAGRLVETFRRGDWSADRIMSAALSGHLGGGVS